MIKLENFIITPDKERTKVKFNNYTYINNNSLMLTALFALYTDQKEWGEMNDFRNEHPKNNPEKDSYFISLAQYYPYGYEYYVFAGLFKVKEIGSDIFPEYEITLMKAYQEYIKRLIIKIDDRFSLDSSNQIQKYETLQKYLNPEIYEILKPIPQQ